jgi:pimeloyl-ACP methyl ester carboxylesterase
MQNKTNSAARAAADDDGHRKLWAWGAGAAAAAGLAVFNVVQARRAEADNPPVGSFIEVDGVRLHYLEKGSGTTIVLLHGNGATLEDWTASTLFDRLAENHRVIAFDRPGFGYSERPRFSIWTPQAQAKLISKAIQQLGVQQPLLVAHSFGTLVAMAMALNLPAAVRGLVLMGGYFYPTVRADAFLSAPPAIPVVGDVLRYTVSPLLGAAVSPLATKKLFDPAPVSDKFEDFPIALSFRPKQIRAEAAEAVMMIPAAAALDDRRERIAVPVTLIAGAGDKIVDPEPQTKRLHAALPGSRLHMIEGAGHMVHYTAIEEVAAAIEEAAAADAR